MPHITEIIQAVTFFCVDFYVYLKCREKKVDNGTCFFFPRTLHTQLELDQNRFVIHLRKSAYLRDLNTLLTTEASVLMTCLKYICLVGFHVLENKQRQMGRCAQVLSDIRGHFPEFWGVFIVPFKRCHGLQLGSGFSFFILNTPEATKKNRKKYMEDYDTASKGHSLHRCWHSWDGCRVQPYSVGKLNLKTKKKKEKVFEGKMASCPLGKVT